MIAFNLKQKPTEEVVLLPKVDELEIHWKIAEKMVQFEYINKDLAAKVKHAQEL